MKDVKPIFECAKANGETKIVDRILVRVLPELMKHDHKLTPSMIEEQAVLMLPDALHDYIQSVAQELTGLTCPDCDGA